MTPFPFTVDVNETTQQALAMMEEHNIRHLPVTRDNELFGVVSERDLSLVLSLSEEFEEASNTRVGDICSDSPYVVELHTPLAEVLLEMAERQIGSALVTKKGKLAGIFTTTDACRCFGEFLGGNLETPDPVVA